MWQDLYIPSISAENPFYQAWKLGHLVGRYIFELSGRETNLIKKCSVRLLRFQVRYTKLERFLPKNQHTKRKLLNFATWNGEVSKIGHHFGK